MLTTLRDFAEVKFHRLYGQKFPQTTQKDLEMPQKVDGTMFMLHTSCMCLLNLMSIPMSKEVHFFDAHRLAPPL